MARMWLRSDLALGLAVALSSLGQAACKEPPPPPAAAPAQQIIPLVTAQPNHHSAAVRLQGTWVMDLGKVPGTALTPEFKQLKAQGGTGDVEIEYTFTDSQFFLLKRGKGGTLRRQWYYQVLREVDDRLELEREDPAGIKKKIGATVRGDVLLLGTGRGTVPLQRKK